MYTTTITQDDTLKFMISMGFFAVLIKLVDLHDFKESWIKLISIQIFTLFVVASAVFPLISDFPRLESILRAMGFSFIIILISVIMNGTIPELKAYFKMIATWFLIASYLTFGYLNLH